MVEVNILVKRVFKCDTYTVGHLYIDGVFICDTLEDKVRDINNDGDLNDPGEAKVWGETAIPAGRYKAEVYFWAKIQRKVLHLLNVIGFSGILMHGGVTAKHSLGCILVGYNTVKGELRNSKKALDAIMHYIEVKKPTSIIVTVE